MRFATAPELELFAESVRGALAGWEAPREPAFGEWWDERDDALAARLRDVGWETLWTGTALLGPAVAGAVQLGRAVAPICLVDEAALGAPLAVGGQVRHGEGAAQAAQIDANALALTATATGAGVRVPTLDGSGTVRANLLDGTVPGGEARVRAWSAATLGYLAGLAAGALDGAVAHARSREQFGSPLAALPAVQARLADARLLADGIELLAWQAAAPDEGDPALRGDALLWAAGAARDVTASAHQVYGAVGFALQSGVHRAYRRAKSLQAWTTAVVRRAV